jgi:hypothetical protein
MNIKIDKIMCFYMKKFSVYNHNCYILPIEVNGCNMILENYCDMNGFLGNQLGVIENGKFQCKYYLNIEKDDKEYFVFESDLIAENNKLT